MNKEKKYLEWKMSKNLPERRVPMKSGTEAKRHSKECPTRLGRSPFRVTKKKEGRCSDE